MSPHRTLSATTLAIVVAMPLAWFACGGSKTPAESPADENSSEAPSSSSSSEAAGSAAAGEASSAPAASGAAEESSAAPEASASAAPAAAAPTPPPPPPFGDSDCGKCIDKTCAKTMAACGKDTSCQPTIDSVHSCDSSKGAAECISAATAPTAKKPKKLAAAYEACAKKAIASKACKATCK